MDWRFIKPEKASKGTAQLKLSSSGGKGEEGYILVSSAAVAALGIDKKGPVSKRQVGFAIHPETKAMYIVGGVKKGFTLGVNGRICDESLRRRICLQWSLNHKEDHYLEVATDEEKIDGCKAILLTTGKSN
ncbi:hypothetical protein [Flavilitoribacter nigricans]|uniref:Uncharacterized protein n=1 Tax=Flavilitoribacter nigricans (strain ATCC 23147 / DSM 23189 / NBRC 102662 / NCIMB 1420 / SS-2) TaxID=1122177 RepID=A0A2D0MYW3_FLAN2|nr:hypothetical protein [Flavilitoribacter nigricans]PHN00653.1 hypothetical protein CRP01_41060 [Flavilitoribacter nigricans DSM 23189 = NBRC 102662]